MRVLLDPRRPARPGAKVSAAELVELYSFPTSRRWLRSNFVTTLDGSAVGADGRSGTVNTPPDNRVFALQRDLCDAVLVGSGTVEAEGYQRITATRRRAAPPALVVVSGSGRLPEGLRTPRKARGAGLLVTCTAAGAARLAHCRKALGEDAVLVAGEEHVDLRTALDALAARGLRHVVCEGGPTLLSAVLAAGVLDEMALTLAPTVVGGAGRTTDRRSATQPAGRHPPASPPPPRGGRNAARPLARPTLGPRGGPRRSGRRPPRHGRGGSDATWRTRGPPAPTAAGRCSTPCSGVRRPTPRTSRGRGVPQRVPATAPPARTRRQRNG